MFMFFVKEEKYYDYNNYIGKILILSNVKRDTICISIKGISNLCYDDCQTVTGYIPFHS